MQLNDIYSLLDKTLNGLGFELVDLNITHSNIIQVFIDKPEGITLDDCTFISNHLSKLLTVENIEYNRLEVSSPGIERPLKKLSDYIKYTEHKIKVKLNNLINKQKTFQGIIKKVEQETIYLEVSLDEVIAIEFNNINKARLVFDFND